MNVDLIRKYNVPGPRYTSYPTVPYWKPETMNIEVWKKRVKESFDNSNSTEGISLYIHLPFCESLCTFCGCNKRITVNHGVEEPYVDTLLKEWELYLNVLKDTPRIKEIHLGGGTPTFFSPKNLEKLILGIFQKSEKTKDAEFSLEGHPANTKPEHLETLYNLGFRRLSIGVQDFDKKVQTAINRHQTYEQVKAVVESARNLGYESINFDIIYGLPFQTLKIVGETIDRVMDFMPERIAFYSYAHVPWVSPGQRSFTDKDLPADAEKRALYEMGKQRFEDAGYVEIGMDHFALKKDSLSKALEEKKLHRNFMGYSSSYTRLMIGLGVSSIGDSWTAFGQNLKVVEEYTAKVYQGELPIFRGHDLSEEDLILRKHILDIMCHFETYWNKEKHIPYLNEVKDYLLELEEDGLVELKEDGLVVPESAYAYVRNVCMAFDAHLMRNKPETQLFSQTI